MQATESIHRDLRTEGPMVPKVSSMSENSTLSAIRRKSYLRSSRLDDLIGYPLSQVAKFTDLTDECLVEHKFSTS